MNLEKYVPTFTGAYRAVCDFFANPSPKPVIQLGMSASDQERFLAFWRDGAARFGVSPYPRHCR